jgi:hypothetical protein
MELCRHGRVIFPFNFRSFLLRSQNPAIIMREVADISAILNSIHTGGS